MEGGGKLMKVWINELIKKVKLSKENFKRYGMKVTKLVIVFANGNELSLYLNKNDYELLWEELRKI